MPHTQISASILSRFNVVISLKSEVQELVENGFLNKKISDFQRQVYPNFQADFEAEKFDYLDACELMTEKDFKSGNYLYGYFYPKIIKGINRKKAQVFFTPKLVITFDKNLCPLGEDGVRYGEIRLGGHLVLAYLYIDFQELIDFIRSLQ